MKTPLPDPSLPWPICMPAVALCSDVEGMRLKAYRCIAGKWTIGRGETEGVQPGMVWTQAQADQRFCAALTERAGQVLAVCTEPPSANELGAMVVLQYNIGQRAFERSTVLRRHNKGDRAGAARAFGLFNKFRNPTTGQLEVSSGLTARRAQEAALYLTPDDDAQAPPAPMPQAVQPESSLVKSPINAGGAATVAGGVFTMWVQYGDQVNGALAKVKTMADTLGAPLPVLLGGLLVFAGVAVMVQRHKQRSGGWA